MVEWFLKSIKVDMENGRLQSLGEALEDFEDLDEVDDVFGLDTSTQIQVHHPGLRFPGLHGLHKHPSHQQIIQPPVNW